MADEIKNDKNEEIKEDASGADKDIKKEDQDDAGKKPSWEDKVKGKTAEEIAKMYGELSQEFGKNSKELGDVRKEMEKMGIILSAIGKSEDREKMVKAWIEEMREKKDDAHREKEEKKDSVSSDVRSTMAQDKIKSFEQKYGIDKLDPEKRKEEGNKLANTIWDMFDPDGKYKTWNELVDHIPLSKLERYMENAYFIVHKDDYVDRSKLEEDLKARENESASLPNMTSVSIDTESDQLSPAELKVAKSLGISPEKYLKKKKEKHSK